MSNNFKKLFAAVAALLIGVAASAQFTTSSIGGKVTDESGEPLAGATVVALHTPSGTQYYAVANAEGRYSIQGMRPGGPYELTVSLIGCQTVKFQDITLALGESYTQDAFLVVSALELDEVVVSATANTRFSQQKTGASVNVSNREMNELPSVSRSISDLTKLSPYANGMSFAGGDGRSTNFTVDGANLNNNFGLSSNLPGGGTPISIDALEEIQLVVAPYDVRQSNFVGGGINAITKSGTNTYKATAYAYYHDENLRGNKIGDTDLGERDPEMNKTFGFTVGGPIIKNKLFFFVNFESSKQPQQTIRFRAATDEEVAAGKAGEGNISKTAASDMQKVSEYVKKTYGYDTGSWTDFPGGIENTKILARVDWNISDEHKLSVRFNNTTNTTWYAPNGNSCDDGLRNKAFNRSSLESMAFANNMYSQQNDIMTVAGELNSRLSDRLSNRFIATYTAINDQRGSNSAIFPHIDIMDGPNREDILNGSKYSNSPMMSLGYELFTYNNGVKNNVFSIQDNITYTLGDHHIVAGASYEFQKASNSYMRNGTIYYRYASMDDFVNGRKPLSACLTIGNNGDPNPRGEVAYSQIGAYLQDEWSVAGNFKLTYGVRADMIAFDNSTILTNNAIKALDFGGQHIDTGLYANTRVQFSPRVGFNWDVMEDKSLIVRGGAGLFQGRLPLVFFTNMPQSAGMIQTSRNFAAINSDGTANADGIAAIDKLYDPATGKIITDVKEAAKALGINTTVTPEDGQVSLGAKNSVVGVDENFRMPQQAKISLAADYTVPVNFPLTLTAEGMFTKTLYGVRLADINLNDEVVLAKNSDGSYVNGFAGADNRVNYKNLPNDYKYQNLKGAYVLTNSNQGYGYTLALSAKAQPVKNLKLSASYVHTEGKEVSTMPGSAAASAFEGLYTVNGANYATLQRSRYVIPDKFTANINYFLPISIFGGDGLHLDLYYTAYSAGGYSYAYANDMNGDGNTADLMYIYPSGAEVNFVEHTYTNGKSGDKLETYGTLSVADQIAAYDKYLAQDKYLSRHKGQYAEANAARSPFVHRFDLRVAEDFSFKVAGTKHNFQLSLSIENLGNMLNSNWGVRKWSAYQTGTGITAITPLTYAGTDASGKPTFYMTPTDGKIAMPESSYSKTYVSPTECWQVLVGIKYLFN